MRRTILTTAALAACLAGGAALAQTAGAPASPSGAPAAAAEKGSSMAGKEGSKNEMTSHKMNKKSQNKMADPHK